MIQIGGFVHKLYVGKTRKKVSIASLYLKPSATNSAAMAAIIIKVNRYNFPKVSIEIHNR
jgi:hypothetical protein